jgi:hypothetical protein
VEGMKGRKCKWRKERRRRLLKEGRINYMKLRTIG